MPDRIPRHASTETHLKQTYPNILFQYTYIISKKYIKRKIFKCFEIPIRLSRHVGLRWVSDQACRSPMGHGRHVGLRCVSDQACRSPMGHVILRWSMSRSPMGLLQVSDNNNIFVNLFSILSKPVFIAEHQTYPVTIFCVLIGVPSTWC